MQAYPHHYNARASAGADGDVALASEGLPGLSSAPPPEYGGPGGHWSPETLFVAAIADCFVLSFRAIAHASNVSWDAIECRAEGVLERVERTVKFTAVALHAELTLPADGDERRAHRLLEKAEESCLVTNSLNVKPTLTITITRSAG
jgi:organic hydroperoxide reductase OsmC/OhrA